MEEAKSCGENERFNKDKQHIRRNAVVGEGEYYKLNWYCVKVLMHAIPKDDNSKNSLKIINSFIIRASNTITALEKSVIIGKIKESESVEVEGLDYIVCSLVCKGILDIHLISDELVSGAEIFSECEIISENESFANGLTTKEELRIISEECDESSLPFTTDVFWGDEFDSLI